MGIPQQDSGHPIVRGINISDLGELSEIIQLYIGGWQHFGYEEAPTPGCTTIPPLGERSADAIKYGYDAVKQIDRLTKRLAEIRGQLTTQMRQDEDIRAARIDASFGGLHRGPHDACTNPETHYGDQCTLPASTGTQADTRTEP